MFNTILAKKILKNEFLDKKMLFVYSKSEENRLRWNDKIVTGIYRRK